MKALLRLVDAELVGHAGFRLEYATVVQAGTWYPNQLEVELGTDPDRLAVVAWRASSRSGGSWELETDQIKKEFRAIAKAVTEAK